MTDDLERRLHAVDPCPRDVPVEGADTPSAQALMRSIMDTHIDLESPPSEPRRGQRRVITAALGAAAAAVLLVGGFVLFADDGDSDPVAAPTNPATTVSPTVPSEPVVATYSLPAGDLTTQMCLPVADSIIPPNAVAFGGTVASVDANGVTIDVDHWYTDGDADQVVLQGGTDVSVALDGVEFVAGDRYLVTVIDDTVSICGVSGPATPELEQLYTQWYG
jgi:hypothetical protein